MLLTRSGSRTGALSGGCLEAEIQKRAWWLTENGPVIECYETSSEEGTDLPFGLGCRGTLYVLLKRVDESDAAWLHSLDDLRQQRAYAALATALAGAELGSQWLFPASPQAGVINAQLQGALEIASTNRTHTYSRTGDTELLLEPLPPRQRLIIFGAGDDAKPLVKFARLLGWDVTVADGRSHLTTTMRFPDATSLANAPARDLPAKCGIREDDAVVVMTHSFAQDEALLAVLLQQPLRYLGQLGPRERTKQLLAAVGAEPDDAPARKLHSPIGLDIGAHTAETIALAIVAEIQATLSKLDAEAATKQRPSALGVSA
jgi:xanthine/CO dehydrogenase XdhC/CoxF family maturation factor